MDPILSWCIPGLVELNWYKQWLLLIRDWSRGVDGMASHPPWVLQVHNFPSKLLPDSISGVEIFKFSGGHAPRPPSKSIPSKILNVYGSHTIWARPTLSKPHFIFWFYIANIHNMYMKDPTKSNLSQPPTLIYFWISACWFWVLCKFCFRKLRTLEALDTICKVNVICCIIVQPWVTLHA